MRRICFLFLTVITTFHAVFAQTIERSQRRNSAYELWLVRSQTITTDIIKDSVDLTSAQRTLLLARLAQQWWREDQKQAHSWMVKAIEAVESVPNKENPDDRKQRLDSVRMLLQIIAPLDQNLSDRLITILTEDAEQQAKIDAAANTDDLIEAAILLVEQKPQRAVELGTLALQIGCPTQIAVLLFKLRAKDAKLANGLFLQALAAARKTLDAALLNSLTHAAFPGAMQPGANLGAPPDDLRAELLKLDVAYLQSNQINAENRDAVCGSIASFVAPVQMEFERLLSQQAVIVRQYLTQCQSLSPLTNQRVDDALRLQPLNTVDDLLKAAEEVNDLKVRTVYMYRAAALARKANDFDSALKILDSMGAESREFMGGAWEAYRWEWAAISALRHLKDGDIHGMRSILDAVPRELQPFAKIAFLDQLPATRNRDTDPTSEFLTDALVGMRRSSLPAAEKAKWYFGLLRLIVKYQPADAIAVLKEGIAALNRAAQAKERESESILGESFAKTLPASLLEIDEYTVKEAIAAITSPVTRAHLRLELLTVCLERLNNAKRAMRQRSATSKGE